MKNKIHESWKRFLKEGITVVDADALGQFIIDHGDGDAQEALNHLEDEIQEMETMREAINDLIADENRLEINQMMDDEQEEIEFSRKWNEED